jgi:putative peptidoglycan lipid II flippase
VTETATPQDGDAAVTVGTGDRAGRNALLVGAGILASRLAGLVRGTVFAHYFGLTWQADAFTAASRIPNLLQNLFGEGVLSGSFIPVYARLIAQKEDAEAGRVAGAVAALLALVVSIGVLAGILLAPAITGTLAGGFTGEKRALTVQLVRILFPGVGLLVLAAWCLGVLNSHRRFLLSYAAPVVANATMIATMLWKGGESLDRLTIDLAWGSVVGSALLLLIQLVPAVRLVPRLRIVLDTASQHVRTVVRNFVPVFVGRGVVQISGYVDVVIASYLPTGAVAAFTNAQTLYMLPVSLFGMAVSASELPAMSAAIGTTDEVAGYLRARLAAGLRRLAYFVVPSAIAFLALGDLLAAIIFRTGRFTTGDARYVWAILAGSAVGLVAATMGRLFASTCYAQHDARTPLRFAIVRVLLTIALGYLFALPLPRALHIDQRWGAAGLTASAGIAAWVEFALLRRAVSARIGAVPFASGYVLTLYASAALAAAAAWGLRMALGGPTLPRIPAIGVVLLYGIAYLALTTALGVPEARAFASQVARRARF